MSLKKCYRLGLPSLRRQRLVEQTDRTDGRSQRRDARHRASPSITCANPSSSSTHYVLNQPEVMIANASQRFDQDGNLTDDKAKDYIKAQMEALMAWAKRTQTMTLAKYLLL